MDEGLETAHQFAVARCDAAELLETAEDPLDEIAMLVLMCIPDALLQSIGSRGNDGLGVESGSRFEQRVAVVGFVRDHGIRTQAFEQRPSVDAVVDLPWAERATCKLPSPSASA